jgi:hypothetical protein
MIQVWSIPPAPGSDVTAVRGWDKVIWHRTEDQKWDNSDSSAIWSWEDLLLVYGPLTDATHEAIP